MERLRTLIGHESARVQCCSSCVTIAIDTDSRLVGSSLRRLPILRHARLERREDLLHPCVRRVQERLHPLRYRVPHLVRLFGQRIGRREDAREVVDRRRQVRRYVLERRLQRTWKRCSRGLITRGERIGENNEHNLTLGSQSLT